MLLHCCALRDILLFTCCSCVVFVCCGVLRYCLLCLCLLCVCVCVCVCLLWCVLRFAYVSVLFVSVLGLCVYA